jgi:2-haloacid dehalogenase
MPKSFVFDAYGTLFDVHSAVMRAGRALGPKALEVSQTWRQKQLEYSWTLTAMNEAHRATFWELTERSLDFALEKAGVRDPALRRTLLDAYEKLDAYADVAPALRLLSARGHRAIIFTNGTMDMVTKAMQAAGIDTLIDKVIASDQPQKPQVFKPHPGFYGLMLGVVRTPSLADIVFVSSNRWDVAGATAQNIPSLWINRSKQPEEYPEFAPMAVLPDLSGLSRFV